MVTKDDEWMPFYTISNLPFRRSFIDEHGLVCMDRYDNEIDFPVSS